MNFQSMSMRRFILVSLAGWLVAAAAVLAQTTPVPVANSPITISFGMIGLAGGQTVRLNAVNIVRTPPAILIAQIPCKVELDLFDAQGTMIKQNVIDNLGYGKSAFVEADRALITESSNHVEVTGVVKVGSAQSFFCAITPTLEIYDTATGRTQAILSSAAPTPSLIRPLAAEPVQ